MRKFVIGLVASLTMMTMALDANAAKRFGGGASFGRSAPTFTQKSPMTTPQSTPTPAPAAAPRPQQQQSGPAQAGKTNTAQPATGSWLSRIGMALGLASLFGIFASMGGGTMGLLLILLVVAAVFFMMRGRAARPQAANSRVEDISDMPRTESRQESTTMNRTQTEERSTSAFMGGMPQKGSVMDQFMNGGNSSSDTTNAAEDGVVDITPTDFDKEGFLKVALENYRKLQKAWDTGNVTQISDFTTDDVFIAITHQLKERGNVTYNSEVLELSNDLLGITQDGHVYLAGVRFTGKIKIDNDVENINEVWTLEKKVDGSSGWNLAGIKQLEGATL